jgi:hypothetical protein
MNSSALKTVATVPFSRKVRHASLAAGIAAALFTGGLPIVGFDAGLVMGRPSPFPTFIGFPLHLFAAIVYGAIFSLAIVRSRNGWTLFAASLATLALYVGNLALTRTWNLFHLSSEADALIAHLVFGATFTLLFKFAEIGAPEGPPAQRAH